MSLLIEYGLSRRFVVIALALLAVIYIVRLTPRDMVLDVSSVLLPSLSRSVAPASRIPTRTRADHQTTKSMLGTSPKPAGRPVFQIKDRVAVISDTQYTNRLVPLILHFHSVLGPAWPIVFYTTNETSSRISQGAGVSAIWNRAVANGAIDVRIIPEMYNMTSRYGVNVYLSRPWLWEQLLPAKHVLTFQTDAMLCGNAHKTMDDFLDWDFIAAPLHTKEKLYNGGLSLRNMTMMMEILNNPANDWERETADGTWTMGGEDIWFSRKMDLMGANLPDFKKALTFACQHDWHVSHEKQPLGYHKVHKNAPKRLPEITEWCPEIAMAAPGLLKQTE